VLEEVVSGPIDESRHPILRITEEGQFLHDPTPHRELAEDEKKTAAETASILAWMDRLYARRRRS